MKNFSIFELESNKPYAMNKKRKVLLIFGYACLAAIFVFLNVSFVSDVIHRDGPNIETHFRRIAPLVGVFIGMLLQKDSKFRESPFFMVCTLLLAFLFIGYLVLTLLNPAIKFTIILFTIFRCIIWAGAIYLSFEKSEQTE